MKIINMKNVLMSYNSFIDDKYTKKYEIKIRSKAFEGISFIISYQED